MIWWAVFLGYCGIVLPGFIAYLNRQAKVERRIERLRERIRMWNAPETSISDKKD